MACGEISSAQNFVRRISGAKKRAQALIVCKKLKAAYLEAVRLGDWSLVDIVRTAAQRSADGAIANLCDQYLEQNNK